MQPSPSGHILMSSCLQDHSRGLVQDTNFSSALPPEDTQILDFIRISKVGKITSSKENGPKGGDKVTSG
jgi:hypothetical protein